MVSVIKYITKKTYRWDCNARYNRFVDLQPFKSITILMLPFLLTFILATLTKDFRASILFASYLPAFIFFLLLRMSPITDKMKYHDIDDNGVLEYFSNKWIARGQSQYVYLIPEPDMYHVTIHIYEPEPCRWQLHLYGDEPHKKHVVFDKQQLHSWSMSSISVLNKKEIDKLGLDAIEAKILLGREDD